MLNASFIVKDMSSESTSRIKRQADFIYFLLVNYAKDSGNGFRASLGLEIRIYRLCKGVLA